MSGKAGYDIYDIKRYTFDPELSVVASSKISCMHISSFYWNINAWIKLQFDLSNFYKKVLLWKVWQSFALFGSVKKIMGQSHWK